jgi:hypothetical protein
LNEENFKVIWKQIIQFLRIEKNEHSLANLLDQVDTLVSEKEIVVEFATKAQKSLFQEHLVDVRSRMVRAFGDEHRLNLLINAKKEIKTHVPITAEDQFKDMASRNEYLIELKKRFGLEFE